MHHLLPMQIGLPGGVEVLVILLILVVPLAVGYWVARDARRHGSDHHLAWGVMAFLAGFAYLLGTLVFLVFYLVVRDDFEPGSGG